LLCADVAVTIADVVCELNRRVSRYSVSFLTKMLSGDGFYGVENERESVSDGPSPLSPMGELTALLHADS